VADVQTEGGVDTSTGERTGARGSSDKKSRRKAKGPHLESKCFPSLIDDQNFLKAGFMTRMGSGSIVVNRRKYVFDDYIMRNIPV
jgi:hypothetical protein